DDHHTVRGDRDDPGERGSNGNGPGSGGHGPGAVGSGHDARAAARPESGQAPACGEQLMGRWAILNGVLVVIVLLLGLQIARTWSRTLAPVETVARRGGAGGKGADKAGGQGGGGGGGGQGGREREGRAAADRARRHHRGQGPLRPQPPEAERGGEGAAAEGDWSPAEPHPGRRPD